jgi:hypothetical protein
MLRPPAPVDDAPMSASDAIFFAWWCMLGLLLAGATWTAARRGEQTHHDTVIRMILVGIAVGLMVNLVPSGLASIDSPTDFKLRLVVGLTIAWTASLLATRRPAGVEGRSAVAFAAFVGVNAPPLALVLSATMVCGGDPSCL